MFRKLVPCFLLLAVFCFGIHGQLVLGRHAPLWDAADYFFPCRLFLSDCLRQGIPPIWNPYAVHGYPFAADPQSGAFYPVAWLFGAVRRYDLLSYGLEHGFTLFVAATGAFCLLYRFVPDRLAALAAGCCYAGCGAFTSNAEHLSWIISAAWLPWVVLSYLTMLKTGRAGPALAAAFFLALMLTGGYPGFFIVTVYGLAACTAVALWRRRDRLKRLVGIHLLFAAAFLLLAGVPVFTWIGAQPYFTRGAGLTVEKANGVPFTLSSFLSFLLPLPTLKNEELFATDVSMRNSYMGIGSLLVLAVSARLLWRRSANRLLLLLPLLFLGCAVGAALPLRTLLYHTLPGMNLFRFPALFRFFALLLLTTSMGLGYSLVTVGWTQRRKVLGWGALAGLALFGALFARSVAHHGLLLKELTGPASFAVQLQAASFHGCLQFQCCIQGLLLLLLALLGFGVTTGRIARPLLLLVLAADVFWAAQLNVFGTVANLEGTEKVQEKLAGRPRDFSTGHLRAPLSTFADARNDDFQPLYLNTGVYRHVVSPDGYNPFFLKRSADLEQHAAVKDSVWSNPVVYLSDRFRPLGDSLLPARSVLQLEVPDYARLQSLEGRLAGARAGLVLERFLPGDVQLATAASDSVVMTLQQTLYPGWKASIDGQPAAIFPSNQANMSLLVPPGRHRIRYAYDVPWGRWLFLSWSGFLLLAVAILLKMRGRRNTAAHKAF